MAKLILRIIAGLMFVVAFVFVCMALSNPGAGRLFYIGKWAISNEVLHAFYKTYLVVMVLLFAISFFVGNKKKRKAHEDEHPNGEYQL